MLKMVTSWAFLVVVANDVSVGSERHLAGGGRVSERTFMKVSSHLLGSNLIRSGAMYCVL